jgi:hypothetical protein
MRKTILALTTLVVSSLFLLTLMGQRAQFEPSVGFERLRSAGGIVPLPFFRAVFRACEGAGEGRKCDDLGDISALPLPSYEDTRQALASLSDPQSRPATHVLLERRLTPEERAFVEQEGIVSLIVPRNVHIETRLIKPLQDGGSVVGMGSHVTLALSAQDVEEEQGVLRLEMKVKGLPWFGPSDFPIVLAKQESTAAYQALGASPGLTANLGRQLQIAIPMLLCLIALFFDHARVFRALAYLAAARAASVFLHVSSENPEYSPFLERIAQPLLHGFDGLLVGLGLTSMVSFALAFTEREPKGKASARLLFLAYTGAALMFLLGGLLSDASWKRADLVADASAGFIVAAILAFDIVKRWGNAPVIASVNMTSDHKRASLEAKLKQAAGIVTFVLFALLGLSNIEAMVTPISSAKTLVDWRFALFYPGLLFVAFLRVGTSSRLIALQADELSRKRVLESELATAKRQMQLMQGPKKGFEAGISWRVWQRQCVSVGGDFFDVRRLSFSDGDYLVAVVLDVTGHGIQAAMIARSLSDAWATWCADSTHERRRDAHTGAHSDAHADVHTDGPLRTGPRSKEEREAFLARAPQRLLSHLSAARVPGTCTAVFVLLDSRTNEVTVCNAGHPSPFCVTSTGHRLLSVSGAHPMINPDSPCQGWEPQTFTLSGETLFIYSDGLFCDSVGVRYASFMKWFRLPGKARSSPFEGSALWKLFRLTQRFYSEKHPKDEDDITLVALTFKVEGEGKGLFVTDKNVTEPNKAS